MNCSGFVDIKSNEPSCSKCNQLYCSICGFPKHDMEITCEENEKTFEKNILQAKPIDEMTVKYLQNNTIKCPNGHYCSIKDLNSNHAKCCYCGIEFCAVCCETYEIGHFNYHSSHCPVSFLKVSFNSRVDDDDTIFISRENIPKNIKFMYVYNVQLKECYFCKLSAQTRVKRCNWSPDLPFPLDGLVVFFNSQLNEIEKISCYKGKCPFKCIDYSSLKFDTPDVLSQIKQKVVTIKNYLDGDDESEEPDYIDTDNKTTLFEIVEKGLLGECRKKWLSPQNNFKKNLMDYFSETDMNSVEVPFSIQDMMTKRKLLFDEYFNKAEINEKETNLAFTDTNRKISRSSFTKPHHASQPQNIQKMRSSPKDLSKKYKIHPKISEILENERMGLSSKVATKKKSVPFSVSNFHNLKEKKDTDTVNFKTPKRLFKHTQNCLCKDCVHNRAMLGVTPDESFKNLMFNSQHREKVPIPKYRSKEEFIPVNPSSSSLPFLPVSKMKLRTLNPVKNTVNTKNGAINGLKIANPASFLQNLKNIQPGKLLKKTETFDHKSEQ
eukprot:TRINITY_DN2875_c0_g2_i1.p1 TRINITY_DN2875_c0_g2~~TRINITY_DN2875_c0_g2_i1.p1  ORF type:complete len:647 (-),score=119.73 TRINITY_DN2875_c0_g2_i1:256-1905(-)